MRFDLLIKGGHVLDAGSGHDGPMDVAVERNRIAAVDQNIPRESAFQVIDASGQYVSPGLVDIHTHVFRGVSALGINADCLGSRTGVTTWIDAGTAGGYTLPGFREFIVERSRVRIFSFLNISGIGLVGPDYELARLEWCNLRLFNLMAQANRDLVLGVKVRMGMPQFAVLGIEPLARARQAADECALPLMVHIAWSPPPIEDVLVHLRPGDIITHCYTGLGMKIIDEENRLRDDVRQALDSGVILDIGHGSGSFSFNTAEALLAEGVPPHVISSDAHQHSIQGPMFDLPTCMSKLLHVGMPLADVFAAVTSRPARLLGLAPEIGTLRPGAFADVAVFAVDKGEFPLYDFSLDVRRVREVIRNTVTVLGGRVLQPMAPEPPAPWTRLTDAQRAFHGLRQPDAAEHHSRHVNRPQDFDEPTPAERDAKPLPREA